ncbi:MAG: hypothetical protein ACREQW_09495 [Candidatus Binatia bacterium]
MDLGNLKCPDGAFQICYSAADAKRVLCFLLGLHVFFFGVYAVTHIIAPHVRWGPIAQLLDVQREVSIPTWFSSLQLFAVGLLLIAQARTVKQLRFYLLVLGLGFLFLSMDEAAAIHEKIIDSAKRLNVRRVLPEEFMTWMMLYVIIAAGFLLASYRFVRFIWRNCRYEATLAALGVVIFGMGGIGLETLSHYLVRIAVDERFFWTTASEELLEMIGISLVLYGVMLLGIKIQSGNIWGNEDSRINPVEVEGTRS